MGFIRAGIKAVKVAKKIKEAGGTAPAIGKGAREVAKRIAPLGTGKIVDKLVGQKIEDAVTKKAEEAKGGIQSRLGHFKDAADSSSANTPWQDVWGDSTFEPTSEKKEEKKEPEQKDPWADW